VSFFFFPRIFSRLLSRVSRLSICHSFPPYKVTAAYFLFIPLNSFFQTTLFVPPPKISRALGSRRVIFIGTGFVFWVLKSLPQGLVFAIFHFAASGLLHPVLLGAPCFKFTYSIMSFPQISRSVISSTPESCVPIRLLPHVLQF